MSVVGTLRPAGRGFAPKRTRDAEKQLCGARGCREVPTGHKPYCIEHLDQLPYIQWLLGELQRRDEEAGQALKHRPIDPDGPLARDIRGQLALHGTMTFGRLSRELLVSVAEIETYVKALQQAGLVETSKLRDRQGRVRPTVALTGQGFRAAG